jgi:hypothetical protein
MSCWLAGSGVGFRIRAGWGCKVRGRQTLVVRAPRPPPPTLRSMGLGNSHATKTECFLAAQPSAVFRSKIRVVVGLIVSLFLRHIWYPSTSADQ